MSTIESFLQKAYNTTIKVKATLQLNKQQIALRKAAGKKGIQLIFFKPSKPIAQTEFVNQRDGGTRVYVNSDSDVAALEVGREVRGAAAETVQVGDGVRQTGDGVVEGIVNKSEDRYNKDSSTVSYERPSKFRKGVRKKTWQQAVEASEDRMVRSPGGKVIRENDQWQMGHKPGYEFRKHKESAEKRGITRKEFLDEHNNPNHYRPELPEDNIGHKYEGPDELNFWDN